MSRTAFLLLALVAGCSTYEERLRGVRHDFASGGLASADAVLTQLALDDSSNAHVYALEQGLVRLALGDPYDAERLLKLGMNGLEDHAHFGYGDFFGAALGDDRAIDYGGEDYEHILLRAILSLVNLVGDGGDAYAYSNAVINKQLEIMEAFDDGQAEGNNPKKAYKLVAFGAYLRAVYAEQDPLKQDVAKREFQRVLDLEPGNRDAAANLDRVLNGRHSEKGNGVLHVFAMVGQGPYKIEVEERASSDAIAIAQVIYNQRRGSLTIPHLASIKVPALAFHGNNPTDVEVSIDGSAVGTTATVTSVDETAAQQFDTVKAWIVARAVLRRVFKTVVVEGAKELLSSDSAQEDAKANPGDARKRRKARQEKTRNAGVQLLTSLVGFAWTAAERADTRCWGLLPASFQAYRVELPAGDHSITLRAAYQGNPTGQPQTVQVRIRDGFDTYVVAQVPTLDGGPQPLSSDTVDEFVEEQQPRPEEVAP